MFNVDKKSKLLAKIPDVLSPSECANLIAKIDGLNPELAPINTWGGTKIRTDVRNIERVIFDDNVTHFQSKWFPGSACRCSSRLVPVFWSADVLVRRTRRLCKHNSCWLERRARCIRCLGLMVPQADGDVRASVNPTTFT